MVTSRLSPRDVCLRKGEEEDEEEEEEEEDEDEEAVGREVCLSLFLSFGAVSVRGGASSPSESLKRANKRSSASIVVRLYLFL